MPTKKELERVLENRDWKQLCDWAEENKNFYRQLMARIYVKDGIVFWRAVEALGVFMHHAEQKEPNAAVELVRRYFWMLNDESGGTAWNASEAIGSILAHCPKTCGHFKYMLSELLDDESLRAGALWGLAQLAQAAPSLMEPLEKRIKPHLESTDPLVRGLAALIYALERLPKNELPIYRPEGPKWSVSAELNLRLKNDQSSIQIYQEGKLCSYSVRELWQIQTIAFWTESVMIRDLAVKLTVASTSTGLCWLSLAPSVEEEQALRIWASRWFPNWILMRKKEPNSGFIGQLLEYFAGKRRKFTIPLHPMGTPFQLKVWEELGRIPYGETRSYGEIAARVGNPKGQRAVGMANHRNPLGIVVPCHRVIGKDGSLTGYAGGLNIKQRLIELEGLLNPQGKAENKPPESISIRNMAKGRI